MRPPSRSARGSEHVQGKDHPQGRCRIAGPPLEQHVMTPLTALSDDERMFQSTVRRFAREQIRPHVRSMDEAGLFRKEIIQQFFEMGLMGIEIPEEFGGQGGSFFQAILAVEELSAVDPSA